MENINIAGSESTPEVAFDFEANTFALRGMSYMEDAGGFFDPVLEPLKSHLEAANGATIQFEFALEYFNSSSARVVFKLFELLDAVAATGNDVTITWNFGDDEDMEEQGEEFGEDLENAKFVMIGDQN